MLWRKAAILHAERIKPGGIVEEVISHIAIARGRVAKSREEGGRNRILKKWAFSLKEAIRIRGSCFDGASIKVTGSKEISVLFRVWLLCDGIK